MIDTKKLLLDITGEADIPADLDLIESGLLDSLAIIELFTRLEEEGLDIPITRIDRNRLRTADGIHALIEEYAEKGA
jgi:acyl carrier protein